MPSYRHRTDIADLKSQIARNLGRHRADNYFHHLKLLLTLKLTKPEFDKLCRATIGWDNVALHNRLIRAILANACLPHAPTGHSRCSKVSNVCFEELLPPSPRRRRRRSVTSRRLSDRPSPLGPCRKADASKSEPEVISSGSKGVGVSVEGGEEVEQAWRSPMQAPMGIIPTGFCHLPRREGGFRLCRSEVAESCRSSSELPDTRSLMKRVEHRLEIEGLSLSVDGADSLNIGLDAYMKRLIKACVDLARSRCGNESLMYQANGKFDHATNGYASILDFQMAMESNPKLLGVDWPLQLEKICLRSSEE